MNTSEFTCGHCGQAFFVTPEQFGQQVECPHCLHAVTVQAPQPQYTPQQSESRALHAPEAAAAAGASAEEPALETLEYTSPPAEEHAGANSALDFGARPATPEHAEALPPPTPLAARPRNSQLAPLLLVFLIPYALVSTGAIAYLVWQQQRRGEQMHPLEMLLDQKPEDGGPTKKQIKHDYDLPDKLKKSLNQPFRVDGFVEVTAQGVALSPTGEQLSLTLLFRNISADLEFNPMPNSYLVMDRGYTYLEFGQPPHAQRVYGGQVVWRETGAIGRRLGKHEKADTTAAGMLAPGQEKIVTLSTLPDTAHTSKVKQLANYRGPVLWRLEIRRGLVEVRGQEVSAAMVLGIEFDSAVALAGQSRDARARPRGAIFATLALAAPAIFPHFSGRFLEKNH
jgi:DNA-directed RNA polymerase subunit RPC12/RpoP